MIALPLLGLILGVGRAQTPAQLELFEKNARPVFAEKCQGVPQRQIEERRDRLQFPSGSKRSRRHGDFRQSRRTGKERHRQGSQLRGPDQDAATGQAARRNHRGRSRVGCRGAPTPAVTPSAGDSLDGTGVRPVALRGVITDADKNFWSFKPRLAGCAASPQTKRLGPQSRSTSSFSPTWNGTGSNPPRRPIRPPCSAAPPSI